MIDYVDPSPFIVEYLEQFFQESEVQVIGGAIPGDMSGTILSVRNAGGSPYAPMPFTRLMVLARATVDYTAHDAVNAAVNELQRYGRHVKGVKILKIEPEGRPIDSLDDDTGQPEAWQYIAVKHLEA